MASHLRIGSVIAAADLPGGQGVVTHITSEYIEVETEETPSKVRVLPWTVFGSSITVVSD